MEQNNISVIFKNDSDSPFARVYRMDSTNSDGIFDKYIDLSKVEAEWLMTKLNEKIDD